MIPRLVRLCLVWLAVSFVRAQPPGAAPGALPTNPPNPPPGTVAMINGNPNDMVTLKLPDNDIDTVLSTLEIFTGRTVLHPAGLPTTNYNIKMADPLPKWQAVIAIETVLALNNVGIAPLGDKFIVATVLPQIRSNAPMWIAGSAFDYPASGRIAMKVFQLEFLRALEVQGIIQQMLNPNLASPAVAIQNANAFILTDSVANLQRIEALLQQIDKPITAGMKPKFYGPLTNASAAGVVNKMRSILQGTLQTQLGTATSFQADERTNQIILVTDSRQYPFFDELIAKLDVKSDPNTRNDVIYLNHAKAQDLVDVLNQVIRGQSTAAQRQNSGSVRPGQIAPINPTPVQPNVPGAPVAPALPAAISAAVDSSGVASAEFSAFMTIAPDARSNSVIVSGTSDDLRIVTELIRKLDVVLAQVRIEVVIAEVTLDDNHDSGVSQLGLQLDGDKLIGFSAAAAGTAIAGKDGTGFATITRPGTSGGFDLAGTIALGTTKRKNNTTILTVPAVTTSHGKKAIINDGETRPVINGVTTIPGASTGATTQSQIQQQDIGTTLTVTPFIGTDGSVQLDLEQELTDVVDTVTVDNNTQYVIAKRKTTNYITAHDGEIIVLAGFRKKIDSRQTNRLGPIPIIGDLLGSRKRDKYHQELIFFLRPQVLTNNAGHDNAPVLKQVEQLPTRDEIKQQLDPNYVPPQKSVIDRILSK